jgi:hypothetical protein
MTNILTSISTYDINTHTPYPTLAYIKEETGEDMTLNEGGNSSRAKALSKQVTDYAYLILKETKDSLDTINRLEYKIATDEAYRLSFLKYVCAVISAMYVIGSDFLYHDNGKKGLDRLPPIVRPYITGSILSVGKFERFEYRYHVGY